MGSRSPQSNVERVGIIVLNSIEKWSVFLDFSMLSILKKKGSSFCINVRILEGGGGGGRIYYTS